MAPQIITLRNDDEIDRALTALGADQGNRSAVIKAAVLHYAASKMHEKGELADELTRIRAELGEIERRLGIYLGVAA